MFFFIPYRTERRTRSAPVITYALIAANVFVFLLTLPLDHVSLIDRFGVVPLDFSLVNIFTSMFMHANVLHLAWNMLFLWIFGPNVEDAMGHVGYTLFYLASGIAAALMHIGVVLSFIPDAVYIPAVGASGAIAGVLGAYAIRFYKTGIRVFWFVGILFYPLRVGTFTVSATVGLGIWFVQQLAGGVLSIVQPLLSSDGWLYHAVHVGGVAYWSHIGGMLFGMLLAYAVKMGLAGTKEYLMEDAQTHLAEGTTLAAGEQLRALLTHDPDNLEAHRSLAKTYAMQQDEESALVHYQRSIEMYLASGDSANAIATFAELRHFFRKASPGVRLMMQLARQLLATGYSGPAVNLFLEISTNYPGTPEAEVSLMKAGDIYLSLSDHALAERCYERFLQEYPDSEWRHVVVKSMEKARRRL